MAVVFRSVLHSTIFAAIALGLTHCSTLSAPRKKAPPLAPVHHDEEFAVKGSPAEKVDDDFDPEFRLESLRHDLAKTFTNTRAIPSKRSPEDAEIARLPVKRLVPEWKPIVPDGDLEDEMDDESALPRYALPTGSSEATKAAAEDHVPGTVAESSAETIDELYEAEVHFRAGHLDRGLVSLRRFLERDPRHAYADRAARRIAEAHLDAGEWTLAIAAANRCAIDFPGTLSAQDAVHIRAKALKALGYPVASSAAAH